MLATACGRSDPLRCSRAGADDCAPMKGPFSFAGRAILAPSRHTSRVRHFGRPATGEDPIVNDLSATRQASHVTLWSTPR